MGIEGCVQEMCAKRIVDVDWKDDWKVGRKLVV